MSDNSYTATLIGDDSTTTIELELIDGLPQKSFVRPVADSAEGANGADVDERVWELVTGAKDAGGSPSRSGAAAVHYEYRPAGIPGADYS